LNLSSVVVGAHNNERRKEKIMSTIITGIVTNGVIIPDSPLPEGAFVEIHLHDALEIPADLLQELAAWQQASSEALTLVERLTCR
jgi:hypothetical protein